MIGFKKSALCLALLVSTSANAAIIEIFDGKGLGDKRVDWENAAPGFMEEDFLNGILEDFTITPIGDGHDNFGIEDELTDRLVMGSSTTIMFNEEVTAFGADWDLSLANEGFGILLDIMSEPLDVEIPDTHVGDFFGFTSNMPFKTVTLLPGTQGGTAETYSADDFVYLKVDDDGSIIAGVPEPATLAMFGLGLAGLGVLRRKKSA